MRQDKEQYAYWTKTDPRILMTCNTHISYYLLTYLLHGAESFLRS